MNGNTGILIGLAGAAVIILLLNLWRLNALSASLASLADQRRHNDQLLDHQLDHLEESLREQAAQQTLTLTNAAERAAMQLREQSARESGEQQARITAAMADLQQNLIERFGQLEMNQSERTQAFGNHLTRELREQFGALVASVEGRLSAISNRVDERLTDGFRQTNETFTNIIERLSKIDEAQKKIESLSGDIVSLQDVLTDKKNRGIFGEVQLQQILSGVFGSGSRIFSMQHKMRSGAVADAVLMTPEPLGMVAVDSKFPLEDYRRMVAASPGSPEYKRAAALFKSDIKKHVSDIAAKYIIPNETADQAIMFVPAEAIFAEIHARHDDLVTFANRKRVWLASPTTLMAVLTTVQVMIRNMERDKLAREINLELNLLGKEFGRYQDRWTKLRRTIETVSNDVRQVHTTSEKITKRFNALSRAELETEDTELTALPGSDPH